tara:strand:+ start:3412 stop:3585 length:174 start_codon:yes stop_codon:yes gene_type:complete
MEWGYLAIIAFFATWLMIYHVSKQVDYNREQFNDLTSIVRSIKYNYMREESERQKKK